MAMKCVQKMGIYTCAYVCGVVLWLWYVHLGVCLGRGVGNFLSPLSASFLCWCAVHMCSIELALPEVPQYVHVHVCCITISIYIQAIHRHKLSKHWLTRLVDARVSVDRHTFAHITITACHKCTHLVKITKGGISSDHSLKSGLVYLE